MVLWKSVLYVPFRKSFESRYKRSVENRAEMVGFRETLKEKKLVTKNSSQRFRQPLLVMDYCTDEKIW